MKQTKPVTKLTLLGAVIALLLCVAMLLGTTYAWFTDSVTSAGNIIKTGKLKVAMQWANGTEVPANATWENAAEGAIFEYDKWEPGYVQVRHIRITNTGNLALHYELRIVVDGDLETVDNAGHTLADAIDVYYADPAVQVAGRNNLTAMNRIGTLTEVLNGMNYSSTNTAAGDLYPTGTSVGNTVDTVTIALKMRENAGNEYQDKELGASFSVQLLATQLSYESDSFGPDYDGAADGQPDNGGFWPPVQTGSATVTNTGDGLIVTAGPATVTVPADQSNEEGDIYTLTVQEGPANPNLTIEASNSATTYDVTLEKNGHEVVVTNGVAYKVELNIGTVDLQKFYHNSTALTAVGTLVGVDDVNEYFYDPDTGIVTFITDSFSPFTAEYLFAGGIGTAKYPYLIADRTQLEKINDHYSDEAPSNYMMKDQNMTIDATNMPFIRLHGCFDGNGVVFNNVTRCLFYDANNGTNAIVIKNLTVNANIARNSYFESAVLLYPDHDVTFVNVDVHGYIEGTAAASYVAMGPGPNTAINYKFVNCHSDATVVAIGESAAGFIAHPYCADGSTIVLENSRYTGAMVAKANTYYFRVNYSGSLTITTDETNGDAYYTNARDTYSGNSDFGCRYTFNSSILTVNSITAPDGINLISVPMVEGASYAVATLNIGPNDVNGHGNYMGVYMNENCVVTDDYFWTTSIKNFIVTINGNATTATGISADGTIFNVVNSYYGNTYGSAFVRIVQYSAEGRIVQISILYLVQAD